MVVAYLCNLLFVINHQQGYRQKDDSEALNGILKSSGCGQLVALLQAGDEIRETQAHSRQPLLCPTVLRRKSKIKKSFSILWNQLETMKKRNRYINKKKYIHQIDSCTFQFLCGCPRRQGRDGSPR